jgi:hypothetical protein
MVPKFVFRSLAACAACLSFHLVLGQATAADPPYHIVLRSRSGVVTPEKNKNAQTGGGYIQVIQVEPNQVLVLMRGAVVAGAGFPGFGHKAGMASMQLELDQDFEVVPTRANLRPPRMIVSAWLIGALSTSQDEPGAGTAEHSPACAVIQSADHTPLFNVCIKPHSVSGGQNLLVNDRMGPIEMTVVPCGYHLHQTLAISAAQPKVLCHSGVAAAADFDPEPHLDSRWNEVLKPFRASPHRDFGFRIILQVLEEPETPGGIVIPETLHRPTPEGKKEPSGEEKPMEP